MVRLERGPFDPGKLLQAFCHDRQDVGAVVSFTGLTRATTQSQSVIRLTLDAYPGFTEAVMQGIETEALSRFDVLDTLVVHRWGPLEIGEPIVFVAVAAEHRRAAFDAADFLMDQLKTRAPFWKREDGPDGSRWIDCRPQDYQDADRWTHPGAET